jgi:hypothetical protein
MVTVRGSPVRVLARVVVRVVLVVARGADVRGADVSE